MDIRTPISTNGGDWQKCYGEAWQIQIAAIQEKFGGAIEEVRVPPAYPTDVPIIYVKKEAVVALLQYLKTEPLVTMFSWRI